MKFLINLDALRIEDKPCVSIEVLEILSKSDIVLELDVIDTDPENKKNKETMVFIHGNSSSKKVFENQIKYFSENFRVVAYDLLGHGDSSKISNFKNLTLEERALLCADFYNPCSMIAQAVQLLESLKINKSHMIGWSLGGHIAYGICVENPNLVSSLMTIGSPPVCFNMSGLEKGFHDFFTKILLPDWINNPRQNSVIESCEIGKNIGFPDPEGQDQFFVTDFMGTDPLVRKYLFVNNDQYKEKALDAEKFIANTDLPIYLMSGEKDAGIKPTYMQDCVKKLKHRNSQVQIVKDAPHAIFRFAPDMFDKCIENFVKLNGVFEENKFITPLLNVLQNKSNVTSLMTEKKEEPKQRSTLSKEY